MTFQNALNIAKKYLMGYTPAKYAEFSTCFVFYLNGVRTMDGAISVDKQTGEIRPFRPDVIPFEEAMHPNFKPVNETVRHSHGSTNHYILRILQTYRGDSNE